MYCPIIYPFITLDGRAGVINVRVFCPHHMVILRKKQKTNEVFSLVLNNKWIENGALCRIQWSKYCLNPVQPRKPICVQ